LERDNAGTSLFFDGRDSDPKLAADAVQLNRVDCGVTGSVGDDQVSAQAICKKAAGAFGG
jgi:hypothetical protein